MSVYINWKRSIFFFKYVLSSNKINFTSKRIKIVVKDTIAKVQETFWRGYESRGRASGKIESDRESDDLSTENTVEIFRYDLCRRKDQDERECKILWREENMDRRFSIHELIHKNWNVRLKRSDTINRRLIDSLLFQGTRSSCLTFLVWYEREKKHNVFRVIQPVRDWWEPLVSTRVQVAG